MRRHNSGLPGPEAPVPTKLAVSTSMGDRVQERWGTPPVHPKPSKPMYVPHPSTPMQRTFQGLWFFLGVLPGPLAGRASPARVLGELPPSSAQGGFLCPGGAGSQTPRPDLGLGAPGQAGAGPAMCPSRGASQPPPTAPLPHWLPGASGMKFVHVVLPQDSPSLKPGCVPTVAVEQRQTRVLGAGIQGLWGMTPSAWRNH